MGLSKIFIKNKVSGMHRKGFDRFVSILMVVCILASFAAEPISAMAADNYTVSGTVTQKYNGPVSPLASTGTTNGPVEVPVSLGQTITGSLDEKDYKETSYNAYADIYQLTVDADQPFAVEVSGQDVYVDIIIDCPNYGLNTMLIAGREKRYPESGFGSVNDKLGSDYDIKGGSSVHIRVYSEKPGAYTLKIVKPIGGAVVNFGANSDTAKAPLPAMTDAKGAWSRSFDTASTYQASMKKDGYSFSPDTQTVNGASTALDFSGVEEDVPEITDLLLDKDFGTAGQAQTVSATINANAPDGTPASVYLIDSQGANPDLIGNGGSISSEKAEIPLTTDEYLKSGFYQVIAQIGGSSATVSKPFTVSSAASAPKVTAAKITPDWQYEGDCQTAKVDLQTENVPDTTKADVIMTDSLGNPVNPSVVMGGKTVIGNKAAFDITIPSSLKAGSYNVHITVNTAAPFVINIPYTIKTGGNAITSFTVPGQTGRAVINGDSHTVTYYVPDGTDVNSLKPTIGISQDSNINPQSETVQDFSSPVTYSVTSQDGKTQQWTVTCAKSALSGTDITAFSLTGQTEAAVIDSSSKTINVNLPKDVNIEALMAAFTLSEGASAYIGGVQQQSGVTVNNFTNSVPYTVVAEDGTSQNWTVNCAVDIQPGTGSNFTAFSLPGQTGNAVIDAAQKSISVQFPSKTDISSLAATFTLSEGASAYVGGVRQQSGVTANDFTKPVQYTVMAENGSAQQWTVNCTVSTVKSGKDFTAFSIPEETSAADIDKSDKTIRIQMPGGSSLKKLTATFTLSEGASATVDAIPQVSGVTVNDFTNPVQYTVTAEDGTSQIWTVTCSTEPLAASYSASGKVFLSSAVFGTGENPTGTNGGYTATPIECGATVKGEFTASSPVHSDGSHYALYSFYGAAGQKVKISLSSNSFNPYVQFWNNSDPYAAVVLDKAGGFKGGAPASMPSSCDYFQLPSTGTFYIFTNTYTSGETGTYTLKLEEIPQAGVTMTFGRSGGGVCPAPVTTSADGSWSQTGFVTGATYTVTPSLGDDVFPTASRQFTVRGDSTGLNFTAMTPGIKVNAVSEKNIIAGNKVTANWAYLGNPGTVKIEVLKGTTVIDTADKQPVGTDGSGSYVWTIPAGQAVGSDYAFRVTGDNHTDATSTSPAFSIGASTFSLTNWSSGKKWSVGQTYNIAWSYAGNASATVKLELMDGTSPALTIADAVNIDKKTYAWTIPEGLDTSKTYSIRLTRSDTAAVAIGEGLSIIAANFTAKGQLNEIVDLGKYTPAYDDWDVPEWQLWWAEHGGRNMEGGNPAVQ